MKNTEYNNISDSKFYIKFNSNNEYENIEDDINKFKVGDIITLYDNNNLFKENKNYVFKINKIIEDDYILFLDNYRNTKLEQFFKKNDNNIENEIFNEKNDNEILIRINFIDNILNNYLNYNVKNIAKLKFNQQQINNFKNYLIKLKNDV